MTIKELNEIVRKDEDINIDCDGIERHLFRDSQIDMDAYGDYIIDHIRVSNGENAITVSIKTVPQKENNAR